MKFLFLGLFFSIVFQDAAALLWREDGKCGPNNKLEDGNPSQCDPQGNAPKKGPCCSQFGFCGNTEKHCGCQQCVNYGQNNGLLPEKFLGTYKQTSQTGLEGILTKIGIDWFKRQMALKIVPKHTFSQSDNMITISSDYFYKKFTQEFKLGVPFQKTSPDGRNLKNTVYLNGNKLLIKREPESEGGVGQEETWEFKNDGNTLEVAVHITNHPEIKSLETFQKQ